jgi:acetylornithine deacetylase
MSTQVRELLQTMVSVPSVNPRDVEAPPNGTGEGPLAALVASTLEGAGLEVRLDQVLPGRPNVIATLAGRDRGRALLLETHLDTVEVDGMTIPPFTPEVRGGRLQGRGSCDAKGCLAAFMTALTGAARRGVRPPTDVVLAAVMDEEHRFRGVLRVLDDAPRYRAAVVGEPSELRLVAAHKGSVRIEVRAHGRTAHSSQPADGDNAVERMADVIAFVRDRLAPDAERIPHPLTGPATVCPTIVRGGSGFNVVPGSCSLFLDRRTLPGEDAHAVWREYRDRIQSLAPGAIEVVPPALVDLALDTPRSSPVVEALAAAMRAHGLDPDPIGVNYGTDASKIADRGIPSVVFGPGSIADAHQPDESVELAQVEAAAEVVAELIAAPAAP